MQQIVEMWGYVPKAPGPYGSILAGGGLGAVGYTCNSSICYGTNPNVHARFKEFQHQLNRAAAGWGEGKIAVDGFIGAMTVKLADRFSSTLGSYPSRALLAAAIAGDNLDARAREAVNQMLGEHDGALEAAKRIAKWETAPVKVQTSTGTKTVAPAELSRLPAGAQPVPGSVPSSHKVAFAVGALFIVGLGGVILYKRYG